MIPPSWKPLLSSVLASKEHQALASFLESAYRRTTVFPPKQDLFSALELTPFEKVKVVILGQDPYHGPNQAHGLAFSVLEGNKTPPSLKNIFKELEADLGCKKPSTTELTHWAEQGVLLLNAVLSVEIAKPGSHQKKGWESITDQIISALSQKREGIVFILWGSFAQKKMKLIDTQKHAVITSAHPSPLSAYRGFFGSKPFSKSNNYLRRFNKTPIDWCL